MKEQKKKTNRRKENEDATCAGSEIRNRKRDNRGITWGGPRLPIRWLTATRTRDWQLSADVYDDHKHRPEWAHSWSVAARSAYRSSCPWQADWNRGSRLGNDTHRPAAIHRQLWDLWNHHWNRW